MVDVLTSTSAMVILSIVLTLHLILLLGCWCAMKNRFRHTDFDTYPHIPVLTWHLFQAIYINELRGVTDNRDHLVEMVAGFYLYGFSSGKKNIVVYPHMFNRYVGKHKSTQPFHSLLVRLLKSAHRNGLEVAHE